VHILPPVALPGLSWTLRALLLKEGEKKAGKRRRKTGDGEGEGRGRRGGEGRFVL